MPKFFAPDCDLSGDSIRLSGENAEHLKVLRVRSGERLTVSDGRGREALCEVAELSGDSCSLRILERGPSRGEPTVSAWLRRLNFRHKIYKKNITKYFFDNYIFLLK